MPPLALAQDSGGEVERVLHVGLRARGRGTKAQIVAVNLIRQEVTSYGDVGPVQAPLTEGDCQAPSEASCDVQTSGPPGQCWISWPTSSPLWTFLAIRPSASSGQNASGVELRYVDYQGKRVLYQAHIPILNVKYDQDACGPYRDWMSQEMCFDASGRDIAPGFRWCDSPPQTICDTNRDGGNYNGVAIYEDAGELVLTSVMAAGWYRYIQEWRFNPFGIIHARLKFAATGTYCICNPHTHHAYWRFDFDITTPGYNLVEEFNDPPIFPGTNWHKKVYEIKRYRDYSRNRKWRVSNTVTGDSYHLVPGPNDGVADSFGQGDLWVLRYHGAAEIDDSSVWAGDQANLDAFVNGELVENQDLVVWYGAHFYHDITHSGAECHEVGPDIVPAACVVQETAQGTDMEAQLDDLRAFRDQDLRPSAFGSRLIELLEANDPELVSLLRSDQRLRSRAVNLLRDVASVVGTRTERLPAVFEEELIRRAEELLEALHERGSPRLREALSEPRGALPRFRGLSAREGLRSQD